ncbi:MAG: DNA primase, partial [Ignavibacteria bacterium GWF2_33_9]
KNAFSFAEAMKFLAQKYGIKYEVSDNYKEASTEYEEIYNVLKDSAEFFIQKLSSAEGKKCRDYFKSRQFTQKTIEEFQLGYSPNSFDALSKYLIERGYEEEIIAKSGMNVQNENNRVYDRFRDRAMFPVYDTFGRIIGFGARLLNDDKTQPKYLNSPQTKVYDKSRTLYGLYQSKNTIIDKKFAILVEGYADVITLYQNGFKNAIASSGTSLTADQLKLLSRFSKNLTIVYDSDSAGINAAERAIDIALQNGFNPNVISLPSGEDPDSIVRDKGNKAFQNYLDNQMNFLDFIFEINSNNPQFENVLGKTEVIKKIMLTINLVPDEVQKDLLIQEL